MDLIAFPLVLLAGMWLGDYLGRKFPTQWALLRAGIKARAKEME